ncbi:MAG: hypothetical protein NCA08_03125 [Deltaproteobacteria bacterium]|nr:hypothetical protein [Candidatus Deferrimicrobium borealis]
MAELVSVTGVGSRRWRDLTPKELNIVAVTLLFLATLPMLTKIFTSDFGTHIAMGRYIWDTWQNNAPEFLNYPALGMPNFFHEWGFQFILYGVFSAGGPIGVSIFLWIVVYCIFLLIYRSCVLRGAHPLIVVLSIFAFSGFLRIRIQPRPEILTYLFIATSIYIFSEYYYGTRKKVAYIFPVLMLLWGNIHGSYLIGLVLWGVFFSDAMARAVFKKEFRWDKVKGWIVPQLLIGGLGLALCGLSPDGYSMLLMPLRVLSRDKSAGGFQSIFLSISELTPVRGTGMFVYYKAAAIASSLALILGAWGRRVFLLDILLAAMAFKGAWDSARAVSMIGLFLSPGISIQMTAFLDRIRDRFVERSPVVSNARKVAYSRDRNKTVGARKGSKVSNEPPGIPDSPRRNWTHRLASVVVTVSLIAFGIVGHSFSFSQLEFGIGMTEHKFSFKATEFLRKYPIPGNMFNFFDIGGFLDWQLYPPVRTFIDGRAIRQDVFQEHQIVTSAAPGWENVIRKYGITYIVLKGMDSSGSILPIVPALANDPGWSLVFSDGLFLVFVRNVPELKDYIRLHEISKGILPQHIINEAHHYMYLGISPIVAYQTMSNMYLVMGRRDLAVKILRKALEEVDDPYLRARVQQLEGGAGPR